MLEEKLNSLRTALNLAPDTALTATQYDEEVVDALKNNRF